MSKRAFLSYVSENSLVASQITEVLRDNGIDVWFAEDQLKGGQSWLDEIRRAILEGSYFIPLFSKEWNNRERSVANRELQIAIDELLEKPYAQTWIIPVKINDCTIPKIPIGPMRSLHNLHYIDFSKMDLAPGFAALLKAMGIESPIVKKNHEGSRGWPAQLFIVRRDKWLNKVPVCYFLNGKHYSCACPELHFDSIDSGVLEIFSEVCFERPMIGTTKGFKSSHFRARSDTIKSFIKPGHKYELFVSADAIKEIFVSSPLTELYRYAKSAILPASFYLHEPKTWPKIQMNLRDF